MGQGYVVGDADNIPLTFSDYMSCHSDEGGNAYLAFICSRKPPTAYAEPAPTLWGLIATLLVRRKTRQNRKLFCFTLPGLVVFGGGAWLSTCRSSGAGGVHDSYGGPGNIWPKFV